VKILIPTIYNDVHAIAVEIALRRQGHIVQRWCVAALPSESTLSLRCSPVRTSVEMLPMRESDAVLDGGVDVLWNRRLGVPRITESMLPASDKAIALRDLEYIARSYLRHLSRTSLAINALDAARMAEDKYYQLNVARDTGLQVPETLLSNNPSEIRDFLGNVGSCICKPLRPAVWRRENGDVSISMTNRLTRSDLPSDEILRAGPMLFQGEITKKYDVRVTCMGGYLHAVRLNSQDTVSGALDWRATPPASLRMEPTVLPVDVAEKCRLLLAAMNLRFGCIDLIVDRSDQYIFLEVNQMGQFLWIEQFGERFPMLDHFCSFLLSPNGVYDGVTTISTGGFKSLFAEIEDVLVRDLCFHDPSELAPNVHRE